MLLGQPYTKVVRLFEGAGYEYEAIPSNLPALAISKDNLGCYLVTPFGESFEPVEFSLVELGKGYYKISIDKSIVNELGNYCLKLEGAEIEDATDSFQVDPYPLSFSPNPDVCVLTGNVVDLNGLAQYDTDIRLRLVDVPKRIGNSMVSAHSVKTTADAFGNFSVKLLRGATVIIEIPSVGVKNQFTVPDQETANIIDLLPERI